MKSILSTGRLNQPTARIPPRWADDLSPGTGPRADAGTAQPAESVPRNSARRSAPSELAVRRQIWRLHNKERARDVNPLISAYPLFWQRSETSRRETIGSGTGDCAPAPSHTTGRTVFRIRRLDRRQVSPQGRQAAGNRLPPAPCASRSVGSFAARALVSTGVGSPRLHRFCLRLLPISFPQRGRTLRPGTPGKPLSRCARSSSSFAPWPFSPSLQRRYPPSSLLWLLLTSPPLSRGSSPQVRR